MVEAIPAIFPKLRFVVLYSPKSITEDSEIVMLFFLVLFAAAFEKENSL